MNARKVRNAAITAGLCLSMTLSTMPVTAIAEVAEGNGADTPAVQNATYYNIMFVALGGSFADGNPIINVSSDGNGIVPQPQAPTRDGYTFAGWSWHSDFSDPVDFSQPVKSSGVVYALWTENAEPEEPETETINVTVGYFDENGDDLGHDTGVTVEKSADAIKAAAKANVPEGYEYVSVEAYSYNPEPVDGQLVDYMWVKCNVKKVETEPEEPEGTYYNVLFAANGGVFADGNPTANISTDGNGIVPQPLAPTREGYTFAGWSWHTYGGDPVDFTQPVKSNCVIYALWEENEEPAAEPYFEYVDEDGTSYGWNQPVDQWNWNPTDAWGSKHEGKIFAGWAIAGDGSVMATDENVAEAAKVDGVRLYATWKEAVSYSNVRYYDSLDDSYVWPADGPWTLENGEGWYFNPAETGAMAHEGYSFAGWSYDPQGNYPVDANETLAAGDITLYAQWTKDADPEVETITYTIAYTDEAGKETYVTATSEKTVEAVMAAAKASLPEGYEIMSYAEYNHGGELSEDVLVDGAWVRCYVKKASDDVVANYCYRDSLDDSYTWPEEGFSTVINGEGWYFNPEQNGAMSHEGYHFVGWSFNKNGELVTQENVANLRGDVTLYAVWEADPEPVSTYEVTFIDRGTTLLSVSVEEGGTVSQKPADPSVEGYTFTDWSTNAETYEAYDFSSAVTSDVVLYAFYTKNADPVTPVDPVTPTDPTTPTTPTDTTTTDTTTNTVTPTGSVDQGTPEKQPAKADDSKKEEKKAMPQTGDSTNVAAMASAGILGSLVVAAGAFLKRRNN